MRGTSKVVTGWLVAVAIAVATSASAAQAAPALETAVTKAAEIIKQAQDFGARKVLAAKQAKRAEGVAAGLRIDAGGSIRHKELRLVYGGPNERCYSIGFRSREQEPGDPYKTVIYIYANGKHIENLNNPGDATDVCGSRIEVEGYGGAVERGISFWYAIERRP